MDWTAINSFGEKMEMWTTIVVNVTAIVTGAVVGLQWFVRRIEPTARNVSRAFVGSLGATLLGLAAPALGGLVYAIVRDLIGLWFGGK